MIGVFGFLPKEKMNAAHANQLCEQFTGAFLDRNYAIDFHATESGAVGVRMHKALLLSA